MPPGPTGPTSNPPSSAPSSNAPSPPRDRHKLGAHYTPRSYVERLVKPTIIDPLRARWDNVRLAAAQHESTGQRAAAIADVQTRIEAIRAKNQALQAELLELDRRLHDQAGDPALPAPPTER